MFVREKKLFQFLRFISLYSRKILCNFATTNVKHKNKEKNKSYKPSRWMCDYILSKFLKWADPLLIHLKYSCQVLR